MPHFDQPGGVLLAERLPADAFPRGRRSRSAEYREGVKQFLLYVFASHPVRCTFPAGSARRDAFYAGVDEGKHIARREKNARRED